MPKGIFHQPIPKGPPPEMEGMPFEERRKRGYEPMPQAEVPYYAYAQQLRGNYWKNPQNVARQYYQLQALPPDASPPDWLDPDRVTAAYNVFSQYNRGLPWWEWQKPDDPVVDEFLTTMPPPPLDRAQTFYPGYQEEWPYPYEDIVTRRLQHLQETGRLEELEPPTAEQLQYFGITEDEYGELEPWQKAASAIFGGGGRYSSLALGGILGLTTGGIGGAVAGAALGKGIEEGSKRWPALQDILMKLDIPAQYFENILGILTLGLGTGIETWRKEGFAESADAVARVLNNLPAAWQAGRLLYESGVFWPGEAQEAWAGPEAPEISWQLSPEERDLAVLQTVFDRILAGENPDTIVAEMTARLGFQAQIGDLIGHIALDPLNVIGALGKGAVSGVAKLTGALSGNDVLKAALSVSEGSTETIQAARVFLERTVPMSDIADMDWFARTLAGVTKKGEWKGLRQPVEPGILNRLAGATAHAGPGALLGLWAGGPPGALIGAAVGGGWWGMSGRKGITQLFSLTPEARAAEVRNNMAVNVAMVLDTATREEDMIRWVRGLSNTPLDVATELSMQHLSSPSASAIPLVLKTIMGDIEDHHALWVDTAWQRTIVENMASVTGKTVDDVVADLANAKKADVILRQYIDLAAQSDLDAAKKLVQLYDAGDLRAHHIQDIVKLFTKDGVPYNLDNFRAQLYAMIIDGADNWSVKYYNVTPNPTAVRLSQTMKAAQSAVLLGLNPTYLVNNVINNLVTQFGSGVLGFSKADDIAKFWNRWGRAPERLRAGLGPHVDIGEAIEVTAIRKAMHKGDAIDWINGKLGRLTGVMPFTNWSSKAESYSSVQSFTKGTRQAWSRLWKRDLGYDRMPAILESALDNIDPNLKRLVYDAIDGSMSKAEVEAALWSGVTRRSIDSVIEDIAPSSGMTADAMREMLDHIGIGDFLRAGLKDAKRNDDVAKVFTDAKYRALEEISEMTALSIKDAAEKALARVEGEGVQAAYEIMDIMQYEYVRFWMNHFVNMNDVARRAEGVTDYTTRSNMWQNARRLQRERWNNFNIRQRALLDGITRAMGADSKRAVDMADNMKGVHQTWNKYFQYVEGEYTKYNTGKKYQTYSELKDALLERYESAFITSEDYNLYLDTNFMELFASQFPDQADAMINATAKWRNGLRNIRYKMHSDMSAFRAKPIEAWNDFLSKTDGYLDDMIGLYRQNAYGAGEVYRIAMGKPAPTPREIEPVKFIPLDWQVGGSNLELGRAANARRLAQEAGLSVIDDAGNYRSGADYTILQIIKKYGGEDAAKLADNANELQNVDPSLARKAFDNFRESGDELPEITPTNIANEVDDFEARLLAEEADPPAVVTPLGTIDSMDKAEPLAQVFDEGFFERVMPVLDQAEAILTSERGRVPTSLVSAELDDQTITRMQAWLEKVYGQMSDAKVAAMSWGENRRDAALLNYSRRYGIDNTLQAIVPYQFWYTRSMMQWALRAIDRPAWLVNWARIKDLQGQVEPPVGYPTRLRGKMRIPIPFKAPWLGDAVYVDPLHQLFPFEMLMRPYTEWSEKESMKDRYAGLILQSKYEAQEITQQQLIEAINAREGQLWDSAMAEAELQLADELSNPLDFITSLTGLMLPLEWIKQYAKGTPEEIGNLPAARFLQNITAYLTPGGLAVPEGYGLLSRTFGRGQLWDYYVARELTNMAMMGYDLAEIERAIVEKQGDVYMEAVDRVGKYQALRTSMGVGAALWADFFPEGEAETRSKQQFLKAVDRNDPNALVEFFEQNPEYQAKVLRDNWDDPVGQLKNFARNSIWEKWFELSDVEQRNVIDQFGDAFETYFIDKDTRSYDSIPVETMFQWAKALGAYVPETAPEFDALQFEELPVEDVEAVTEYETERDELFSDVKPVEDMYFALPQDFRSSYLDQHPELIEYWKWKDRYRSEHPEILQYTVGEESAIAGAPIEVQQQFYEYRTLFNDMFPDYYDLIDNYYSPGVNKKQFLREHPQLFGAWQFEHTILAQNPELLPYIKPFEGLIEETETRQRYGAEHGLYLDLSQFSRTLVEALSMYYTTGSLGSGARRELKRIWEQSGKPGYDLNMWIDSLFWVVQQ